MIAQHAVFGFTMERKPYTSSRNCILGFEFDLALGWRRVVWSSLSHDEPQGGEHSSHAAPWSLGEQPIHLQPPWNHTAILPLPVKRSKHYMRYSTLPMKQALCQLVLTSSRPASVGCAGGRGPGSAGPFGTAGGLNSLSTSRYFELMMGLLGRNPIVSLRSVYFFSI